MLSLSQKTQPAYIDKHSEPISLDSIDAQLKSVMKITVSDMETSLKFYRDGLQLEIQHDVINDKDYLAKVRAGIDDMFYTFVVAAVVVLLL